MNRKIHIWTPSLSENNGQNIVTRALVDLLHDNCIVTQYPSGILGLVGSFFCSLTYLIRNLVLKSDAIIFLIVSRSIAGGLRDLPCLLLAIFNKNVICHVHGSDLVSLLRHRVFGCFFSFLYRRCVVVVPSAHVVSELEACGLSNLVVCENFVINGSIAEFEKKSRQIKKVRSDNFKILWNSNILSSKGIFDLCQAVVLLAQKYPQINLEILGKPIADEEMPINTVRKEIKKYSSYECIKFVGVLSESETFSYLEDADIVALISTYKSECQPLAVISAMALNKKILVTNTPALRETTKNYPNVYFVDRELKSIIKALEVFIVNTNNRIAQDISVNYEVLNRFSQLRFEKEISEIINDL